MNRCLFIEFKVKALVRCTMNNPGHFMTLKENFPIVDAKPVDDTISKVFFERALIQKSFSDAVIDFCNSFRYGTCRFLKMFIRYIIKKK